MVVKANMGYHLECASFVAGIGLSAAEIKDLGRSLFHIDSWTLHLPPPEFNMIIFSAADFQGIQDRLERIFQRIVPDKTINLDIFHVDEIFYLIPIMGTPPLFLVGLDTRSLEMMVVKPLMFLVKFFENAIPVSMLLFNSDVDPRGIASGRCFLDRLKEQTSTLPPGAFFDPLQTFQRSVQEFFS